MAAMPRPPPTGFWATTAFGKRVRNVRSMGRWTIDNKDRFSHQSPGSIIFANYPVEVAFR
jgi:hypothetical protein